MRLARLKAAVRILALMSLAACGGSGGGGPSTGVSVRFGIFGDTPYDGIQAQAVSRMIEAMNGANLSHVIFVGDIMGSERCDNRVYTRAIDLFNSFEMPLVYVPGDNEWTDCHVTAQDPIERLAYIRRTMFRSSKSFGQRTLTLEQQRPSYPENSRWRIGSVAFVGLNVAGSNNNHIADPDAEEEFTARGPEERRAADAEFVARDQAGREWLRESVKAAMRDNAAALVVVIHADPGFDVPAAERRERRVDGFDALLAAFVQEARAFAKPVVLVHGDSHRYVFDQPLIDPATGERVTNFTRVETYGSPDVGWVEITVDPTAPAPVKAQPHFAPTQ